MPAQRPSTSSRRSSSTTANPSPGSGQPGFVRLTWLDSMKGISILWIVYFHFFSAYASERYPWPLNLATFSSFMRECAPSSVMESLGCIIEGITAAIIQRGPGAVGVFILLSGFGLTYSLARKGNPEGGWMEWYRKRLLRLFPMYWAAHLIYLVSPFVHRESPVDYRFVLSLLGDRIFPVDRMFYYVVPAWWFFGLLIELYLVFPILFRLLQRLGPAKFMVLCILETVVSRYILNDVLRADGKYVMGAFFGARLWEFSAGMVLAFLYRQRPSSVEGGLFSGWMLLGGIALYVLGVYSYQPNFLYIFSDGLIGTGLAIIMTHTARWMDKWIPIAGTVFSTVGVYSYGLYLLHQPYVMYFGQELRGVGMVRFLALGTIVVACISVGSIILERLLNRMSGHLLDRPPLRPPLTPP